MMISRIVESIYRVSGVLQEASKYRDDRILDFDSQLLFIRYYQKHIKDNYKVNKQLVSFDSIEGYDIDSGKDIPGLYADGSLTFEQAARLADNYFKRVKVIRDPLVYNNK